MIAPETQHLGILARWYAEPLTQAEAEALLQLAEKRGQERLKRGGKAHLSPLLKLIALHWLGEPTEGYYHYLTSKSYKSLHAEALNPLIYGQLLISRRIEGAMSYLDEAFQQSRLVLRPQDYFMVLKRHQLLRGLPLTSPPSRGEPLETLLNTAAVIARLREGRGGRPGYSHDPNDTYG